MAYDANDPALSNVADRMKAGIGGSEAYYEVFKPNRAKTVGKAAYNKAVTTAAKKLPGPFSRCQVQADAFTTYASHTEAANAWTKAGGWDFLHLHKSEGAAYRVYIPADLRKIAAVIATVWQTPSLTGFKVAGYLDADNRSDVVIAWVKERVGVDYLADALSTDMLHGMRPPGSSIIRSGCLVGYSEEVAGSSVGTEVKRDLAAGI